MKKLYAKLIKDLRESFFKQTQDEFAQWLGVTKFVVSSVEMGRTEPNASICLQLAAYARTREERDYFFKLAGFTPEKLTRLIDAMQESSTKIVRVNQVRDTEEESIYRLSGEDPRPTPAEEEFLRKALAVLRSRGDTYSPALKQNIIAFHKAVEDSGLAQPEEKKKIGSQ